MVINKKIKMLTLLFAALLIVPVAFLRLRDRHGVT